MRNVHNFKDKMRGKMKRIMMMVAVAALTATANATMFRWSGFFGEFDGSTGSDWVYGTDAAQSDLTINLWLFCFGIGDMPVFDGDSFNVANGTLSSTAGMQGDAVAADYTQSDAFASLNWEEPGRAKEFGGYVTEPSWYAVVVEIDAPGYEGLFGIDVFLGDYYMKDPWEFDEGDPAEWGKWGHYLDSPAFGRHVTFLDPDAMALLGLEPGRLNRSVYFIPDGGIPLRDIYLFTPDGFFNIPEPSSGLLALAGIALLIRRKRSRQRPG